MIKGVIFDFGDTLVVEHEGKTIWDLDVKKTEGVDEMLRELKRYDLKLGVVANTYTSTEKDVRIALRNQGIDEFFDTVITSVDVGVRKPDKRIFRELLKRMKLKPEEVVFVGNQIDSDIVGGNRAGMITVWFHWRERYVSDMKSEDEKPDYIISSLEDLIFIIGQLMPKSMRKKPKRVERPIRGTGELIPKNVKKRLQHMEHIAKDIRVCRKCPLHKTRKNAVPGEGYKCSKIMLVGEAPGREEDKMGRPFVGLAGRILRDVLEDVGLTRRDVFITSILKCRPPRNRNPKKDEMDACRHYLLAQIESLKPKVIVALGSYGLHGLVGKRFGISKVRRKVFELKGIPIIPTYHPAACLYNPKLKRILKRDLGKVKDSL